MITFINDGTKRDYQRLMKQLAIPYQEIFLYDGALHEQPKAKDELEKKNVAKDTYSGKKSMKERKPETVNSVVKEPQETRKKKKNKKKNTKNKGARRSEENNALRASSRTLYRGGFHEISEGRNLSVTSKK